MDFGRIGRLCRVIHPVISCRPSRIEHGGHNEGLDLFGQCVPCLDDHPEITVNMLAVETCCTGSRTTLHRFMKISRTKVDLFESYRGS